MSRQTVPSGAVGYKWNNIGDLIIDDERWIVNGGMMRRDGVQIYFTDDGFEISRRNPDTTEYEVLAEISHIDTQSPYYSGVLKYVLMNTDEIIQELTNDD